MHQGLTSAKPLKSSVPFKDNNIVIDVIVALLNTHPHSFICGENMFIFLKNKYVSEYAIL